MVDKEQLDALGESFRRELSSAMTTTAIQIGASEKVTGERIKGLRWQMWAALVGGQAVAGFFAAVVARTHDPVAPVTSTLRFLGMI